jgi:hypothetical protein
MQLNSIELPITLYTISKQYNNNYFNINVNGSTTTIVIPSGNYTQSNVIDTINVQLGLAGAPFSYVSFLINLNIVSGTGQTMVGPNGSGVVTSIELNFQTDTTGLEDRNTPLPLKLGWLLGFRNGAYVGNLNYVSEGVVDVTGPKYFFLVIDDYNNNINDNFISAFNSSILNKNIIARIANTANSFSILQQTNSNIITTPRE